MTKPKQSDSESHDSVPTVVIPTKIGKDGLPEIDIESIDPLTDPLLLKSLTRFGVHGDPSNCDECGCKTATPWQLSFIVDQGSISVLKDPVETLVFTVTPPQKWNKIYREFYLSALLYSLRLKSGENLFSGDIVDVGTPARFKITLPQRCIDTILQPSLTEAYNKTMEELRKEASGRQNQSIRIM